MNPQGEPSADAEATLRGEVTGPDVPLPANWTKDAASAIRGDPGMMTGQAVSGLFHVAEAVVVRQHIAFHGGLQNRATAPGLGAQPMSLALPVDRKKGPRRGS